MQICRSVVEVESTWGVVTKSPLLSHVEVSSRLAVLFPGNGYGCDAPLLHYARKVALLAGCDTLSLEYGYQAMRQTFNPSWVHRLAEESLAAIRKAIQPTHAQFLFISKSLGTVVAGEVADHLGDLPVSHLFLTPIGPTLPYLQRHKGVVITGSADKHFGEDCLSKVRGLPSLDVVEVPHAGHDLELETDVQASLAVLSLVSEKCATLAKL